jgi:hypothetical protein
MAFLSRMRSFLGAERAEQTMARAWSVDPGTTQLSHHTRRAGDPQSARTAGRGGSDLLSAHAAVEFPGDHGGFMGQRDEFAEALRKASAG